MDLISIPKVHLHLHLEATIRPTTILELYQIRSGRYDKLTVDGVIRRAQMNSNDRSFDDFLAKFDFILGCLKRPADLTRITYEAIADAKSENVRYVELRFCPHSMRPRTGITELKAIEAVVKGLHLGLEAYPDVAATLILIIDQKRGPEAALDVVRWAARYRELGLSGVDIAGDPTYYSLMDYEPACKYVHDHGLGLTVHAGEFQGPETVRMAVERLGASRIGHGIRSVEDSSVVDLLLKQNITLEISVTSNVRMRAAQSRNLHPLPSLLDAGVRVTINTDDPLVFNTTLTQEYEHIRDTFGLTLADFRRMNLVAARAAFVGYTQCKSIYAAVEQGYANLAEMKDERPKACI